MISNIWNKKLIAIVQVNKQQISQNTYPLTFVTQVSWNHYIGFYFQKIIEFFAYLPFPISDQTFWLEINNKRLQGTQIISHLIGIHNLDTEKPLVFVAHFKSQTQIPKLDLQRFFKNTLKASTASRYGKQGARRLTFQMTVNNIKQMNFAFQQNKFDDFVGSNDFESDNLGYNFLIAKSQIVPVRIISNQLLIQRKSQKSQTLKDFLKSLFSSINNQQQSSQNQIDIMQKLNIKIHNIPIKKGEIIMKDLQKYCHPDGFLYFTISL